jgi:hypothetical protein
MVLVLGATTKMVNSKCRANPNLNIMHVER